ncbi:MAG TPA: hypothetical protein VKQ72_07220 [Aggregatilineales bacterium]|nr:hypothetical protein [Aggregatilineales bacterium]
MSGILNMRMGQDEHESQQAFDALRAELTNRSEQRQQIEQLMEKFTGHLYEAFERVIAYATSEGIASFGKPQRVAHPAGGWRQVMRILIEDWSVVIVPLIGSAWPNPRDEARINSSKFKELCGRIALFLGDDPNTESFYDFLIFADGSWFAWGFGWPRIADDIDSTDFNRMAIELLTNFVRDIHATWRPRRVAAISGTGTLLNQSMDAKKRVYNLGLPGEE